MGLPIKVRPCKRVEILNQIQTKSTLQGKALIEELDIELDEITKVHRKIEFIYNKSGLFTILDILDAMMLFQRYLK